MVSQGKKKLIIGQAVCIANCFKLNDELKINQMEKVIKC